ncbi:MAG: pitrilysin family protein [Muribaculaceae bacterium]|nr:pitrilysin family protein [Muribaculaceae bacterium]
MIEVQRHTLSNGLRIVFNKDTTAKMAVVNVLYNVGSKNEEENLTGLAHLFEHLMFGGSDNIFDFDEQLQKAGGESNAWTSQDHTNYYESLPVQNIETAFWLESDRMRFLSLTPDSIEIQRSVVIEEFKERCLNYPYGDINHLLCNLAFDKHHYRWPVIGKDISHIESVTAEDLRVFYDKYYAPSNAVLSVVGDLDFEKVVELAEKWFGDIKDSNIYIQSRKSQGEDIHSKSRLLKVRRDVPHNVIYKGYMMCGRKDANYQAMDLISDILANGSSSRFFQNVVSKGGTFISLDASVWGSEEPGLFLIQGKLYPGVSFEEGEQIISTEIDSLLHGSVTDFEIEKCINKFESRELFANISAAERAYKIAYYEMLSDASLINEEVNKYRALTKQRIDIVVNDLFTECQSSTVHYGPDA